MNKQEEARHPSAKILVLDIETRPALVYAWKGFKENIGVDQIVEPDGVLCVGAKWAGTDESFMFTEWEHGMEGMLRSVAYLMQEADTIVGVNHERFDIPWLIAQFAQYNIPAIEKATLIDLQKFWRRNMRFFSNKLAYVGPLLVGEGKVEHEGFMLWRRVLEGDNDARERMKKYCEGDVDLTEKLYFKLRPFLPNHPYLSNTKNGHCPSCSSDHVHISKYRRTKTMRIQQLHCQNCGSYFDGKKEKMI